MLTPKSLQSPNSTMWNAGLEFSLSVSDLFTLYLKCYKNKKSINSNI